MSIKTLYTNGCSWTYGEELGEQNDPNEQSYKFYNSWPWHVAQQYKIPQLINDARGGGSNERIFRRTVEFIRNTKIKYSELAIIVAWTSAERTEWGVPQLEGYWQGDGSEINWTERQYYSFHIGSDPLEWFKHESVDQNHVQQKAIELLHKNYTLLRAPCVDQPKQSQLMYSLQEICKANGIKLAQFLALTSPELTPESYEYDRQLAEDIDYHLPPWIDTNENINRVPGLHDRGPNGKWINKARHNHPNENGHKLIADFIVSKIGETI
ncbi:MAG: hypothetical protein CMA64_00545 [Euryarchaeota archaeon]|jgi:hypothetical protein|nr:hypothetical protein [Euryarchaeota archaeon]